MTRHHTNEVSSCHSHGHWHTRMAAATMRSVHNRANEKANIMSTTTANFMASQNDADDVDCVKQGFLTGERAAFAADGVTYVDTIFADGESPLKHARNITLRDSSFQWKYPLWYCENVNVRGCTWFEMARAGVWYTKHIDVEDSTVVAPKNFRRCDDVTLRHVEFPNAGETLWSCRNVTLDQVTAHGDYFAMNSENVTVDGLRLVGGYSFDGVKNVEITNSRLITKDAFWNSENVTVRDSFISSEYLGWNAQNLTLINCTIESLQGLCYIENLVMRGCRLNHTNLAFEYSTVDVEVEGHIDSVFNPAGGRIKAGSIGEITLDPNRVDPAATTVECTERSL